MDKYKKAIELQKQLKDKFEQEKLDKLRILIKEKYSKQLTTMSIGIIAEIEKTFGYLWGQGKPKGSLSENELEWRDEWMSLRQFILDRMHNTINNFQNFADNYEFIQRKYTFRRKSDG